MDSDSVLYHQVIIGLLLLLVVAVIWQCGQATARHGVAGFSAGYTERTAGGGEYERGARARWVKDDPNELRACHDCGRDLSNYRDCPDCYQAASGDRNPWSSIGVDRVGSVIGPAAPPRFDDGLPANWDLPDTPYALFGEDDHWAGDGTGPVPKSVRIWSRAEPDHLPFTN